MLAWTLVFAGAAIVAIALVVVLAVLAKRAPADSDRPFVLLATRLLALIWAAVTALFTIIGVVAWLVNDVVEVTMPVAVFWPEPHPWVEITGPPPATVVGGGFTSAEVAIEGLGMDARLWLAASDLIAGGTVVVLALVLALVCHRMLQHSPFRPIVARALMIAGGTIALGGVAWQLFEGFGSSLASNQALFVTAWGFEEFDPALNLGQSIDVTGLPDAAFSITLDFWPIMVGLALAAFSIAFQYGARLQRDTEGLV